MIGVYCRKLVRGTLDFHRNRRARENKHRERAEGEFNGDEVIYEGQDRGGGTTERFKICAEAHVRLQTKCKMIVESTTSSNKREETLHTAVDGVHQTIRNLRFSLDGKLTTKVHLN